MVKRLLADSPRRLPDGAGERLLRYSKLILRYRDTARLTSLRSRKQIEEVLIAESLQLLRLLSPGEKTTVADVGTGAGIPGIVLAIAEPALELTLFERSARKAAFLRIALAELGLAEVEVVQEDVSRLPQGLYSFEVVVSRGAAPLPRLLGLAAKLLAEGGCLLGFTSEEGRRRMAAQLAPGFQPDKMVDYRLSGGRRGLIYALRFSGEPR